MHLMAGQAAIPSANTGKAANLCVCLAEHDRYSVFVPTVYVAVMVLEVALLSSKHCVSQSSLDTLSRSACVANTRPMIPLASSCAELCRSCKLYASTSVDGNKHIEPNDNV